MDFFRKHFTNILVGCIVLISLAYALPFFLGTKKQQAVQPQEIIKYEPPFTHEGNLSIFKKDGSLIQKFEIELAQTPTETEIGLMYRKSMAQNRGMFFMFSADEPRSFWMRNTYIALDIVYINSKLEIVSIVKNAEPLSLDSRPSEKPAQFVLELNAGVTDKLGINVGDTVTYEILND